MKVKQQFVSLLVMLTISVSTAVSHAQPPEQATTTANPVAGVDWAKMTPEQRREALRQFVEQTIRATMTGIGYPDKELQDAVVAFAGEQEKLLELVREKHRKVAQALIKQAPETEVATLMADLKVSVDKANARRIAGIVALDDKISFSDKPRLAAYLSMISLTGSETSFIGGVLGGITGTIANLAAGQEAENAKKQDAADAPPGDKQ